MKMGGKETRGRKNKKILGERNLRGDKQPFGTVTKRKGQNTENLQTRTNT